jgi:hypothetical protein
MYATSDEYLDLVATNGCAIMFEKAFPSGKLKREMISLATNDGRHLTLTTPHGFSSWPFEMPRKIFDHCLAEKFIEQDGPEYPDGRILSRLTQAGRSRVDFLTFPVAWRPGSDQLVHRLFRAWLA